MDLCVEGAELRIVLQELGAQELGIPATVGLGAMGHAGCLIALPTERRGDGAAAVAVPRGL